MHAAIIKIGNSRGVRLPKPILEQCGFHDEVELEIHNQELIIKSPATPRANWKKSFKAMASNGDDNLLDPALLTQWDEGVESAKRHRKKSGHFTKNV